MSANFAYKQSVGYTYFKGHSRSYIDHVFVSEEIIPYITSCSILALHEDNKNKKNKNKNKNEFITITETMMEIIHY